MEKPENCDWCTKKSDSLKQCPLCECWVCEECYGDPCAGCVENLTIDAKMIGE